MQKNEKLQSPGQEEVPNKISEIPQVTEKGVDCVSVQRLCEALRKNLLRRKQQQRSRKENPIYFQGIEGFFKLGFLKCVVLNYFLLTPQTKCALIDIN